MSRTSIMFAAWLAIPQPRWNARLGVWERYAPAGKTLSLVERTVLAEYVDHHRRGEEEIAITSADLEVLTDCCRKKLDAVRNELVEQGLLTVVRRSSGGRGKPTTYRVGERLIATMRNQARDARYSARDGDDEPGMARPVSGARSASETGHVTPGNTTKEPGTTCPVEAEKPGMETGHHVRRNRAPDAPSTERDPRARVMGAGSASGASSSAEPNPTADASGSGAETGPSARRAERPPLGPITAFGDELPKVRAC